VAAAHAAEAVRQMRARARRLLWLNPFRVEAGDDFENANSRPFHPRLARNSGPHAALEEARREAVRHALENVRLVKDISELDVVSVGLQPLG